MSGILAQQIGGRVLARPGDGIGGKIASWFELPGDVVLDLPRVTIVGNAEMVVDNHRGLIRYEPSSITIGAGKFQIVIEGENLAITTVNTESISIRGAITRVMFEV